MTWECHIGQTVTIFQKDCQRGLAITCWHEPLLDGKLTDAGQDITAVLLRRGPGLVHHDLNE